MLVQPDVQNDDEPLAYQELWNQTWDSFNRALRSPDEFNAVVWLFRLVKGYLQYLYFRSGLYKLGSRIHWRKFVPMLGLSLIFAVVLSYYLTLRSIIVPRWCCSGIPESSCRQLKCNWAVFHDFFVFYVALMILVNYVGACIRSPGVALAEDYRNIDNSQQAIPDPLKWKSTDCRGGCCCLDPILDVLAERRRVAAYQNVAALHKASPSCDFPSLEWTHCKKCRISRPPRCHHCSVCNRCILRFDHHCVWLNNCIGEKNYRNFLLTLLYLTIGCWYGVMVLWRPFYESLKQEILEHGWHVLYEEKTGFLNLPPPGTLIRQLFSTTGLEPVVVIKVVVPLLVSVGLLQAIFLSYHIRYAIVARTTLEYKILLDHQYHALVERNEIYQIPHNPFDHGWIDNLKSILGPNPILVLLPIQLQPVETHEKKAS